MCLANTNGPAHATASSCRGQASPAGVLEQLLRAPIYRQACWGSFCEQADAQAKGRGREGGRGREEGSKNKYVVFSWLTRGRSRKGGREGGRERYVLVSDQLVEIYERLRIL